jgi:intracellular septation protein A
VNVILLPHVIAGALGIVSGFVALYAAKGAAAHRRSGRIFVYAMVTLSLSGAVIAATVRPNIGNVIAGVTTFYMVVTALLTVIPTATRRQHRGAMAVGFITAVTALVLGVVAGVNGGSLQRMPAVIFFLFGLVALFAAWGDRRMLRAGTLERTARLKRHLWRMCFAMWVANASFFLGPAGRVPEIIRIPAVLPIPVLVPLIAMVYWLWRLRRRSRAPVAVRRGRPQPAQELRFGHEQLTLDIKEQIS